MSAIADELRPLWMPDLHKVVGRQERGLIGLIASEHFQVYSQTSSTTAELHFSDWDSVAQAFAADCARMSMAAVETLEGNLASPRLPKSIGWLLIRAYYGGFFGAHALGRMLGRSVTRLDTSATNAIDRVAALFGTNTPGGLQRGLYVCTADGAAKTLSLAKIVADSSHEAFWIDFAKLLQVATTRILSRTKASATAQRAASTLAEIEDAIKDGGSQLKGSWLSVIRNRINYQHGFGAWYPYQSSQDYYGQLQGKAQSWRNDPDTFSIWPRPGRELQRFVETSTLLVAICIDVSKDMTKRCPAGTSFHEYSVGALINNLNRQAQ